MYHTYVALITLLTCLTGWSAPASFEEGAVPPGWSVSSRGVLEVTDTLAKSGNRSLHWSWRASSQHLTYTDPGAFTGLTAGEQTGSCLALWVYNEVAVGKPLRAELLDAAGKPLAWFWFWMDFKGWRPLVIRYRQMEGWTPDQAVHALRLHATDDIIFGQLYLDLVSFDYQHQGPKRSYSTPWAGQENGLRRRAEVILSSQDLPLNRPWLPKLDNKFFILREEARDLAWLQQEALPDLPVRTTSGTADEAEVVALRQRLAAWSIRRNDEGRMAGRPVDRQSIYPPPDAIEIADYMKLVEEVKSAFEVAASPELSDELRTMFLDLTEHYLDQGYEEGAANMGSLGLGYDMRNWPPLFYEMRDVLAEAGHLRRVALSIFDHMGAGSIALSKQPGAESNMDTLSNYNRALLPAAMMLPDKLQRLQRLRVIRRHYSLALTHPDVLGPDGSAYHHWMHHYAYSSYSMKHPIWLASLLSNTRFRLSAEAYDRLETYIRAVNFATIDGQQPPNLNGRAGTPLDSDPQPLASQLGIQLDNPPLGHWTMNGAATSLHRRHNWLVSIVGMIEFWRGLEIYGWLQTNNYARYARNGSILITRDSLAASGFDLEGWNWNHWPGTTSLLRPSHELFKGYHMYSNPSVFAGGTQLEENGIWGMDFLGEDVHFYKSAFCFGDRVTVITTDIRSEQPRPAISTLFQAAVTPDRATVIDGRSVAEFPWQGSLTTDQPHWLLDGNGTGYYLHPGTATLRLARERQTWTYMIDRYLKDPADNPIINYQKRQYRHEDMAQNETYFTPSEGDFTRAWLDHGQAPTAGSAVWSIKVNTTASAMQAFTAAMSQTQTDQRPYRVLQQDRDAHILHDRASNTTGYVLFTTNDTLPPDSLLRSNSRPCLVMSRASKRRLTLSVASTDLENEAPITLVLRGEWHAEELPADAILTRQNDTTTLSLPYTGYMPMRIELDKGGWWPF